MRVLTALCLFVLASVAVARPEGVADKFDDSAIQEILENRRLLLPYLKCALDQGKCSADAKELKEQMKEALETECAKCTEAQKEKAAVVLKHIILNEKEYWDQLIDKYDPERKYAPLFEKEYLPQ